MRALLVPLLLATACAPKQPAVVEAPAEPAVPAHRASPPEPLAERPFVLPEPATATLSNGVPVMVVESHEVPLAWVRLSFRSGSATDPAGKEGLASVTLDMLNEGAGKYDAEALSAALKKLGSDLGTGAGDDIASISAESLAENLEPTLDLMATVLHEPTFPKDEWALLQKQRLADVKWRRSDPNAIAARVLARVVHGGAYAGRAPDEKSLRAIAVKDMRAWKKDWLTPDNAAIFVGGDVTLEQVMPMLEARFGAARWKGDGKEPPPVTTPEPPRATTVYVVDKPGAAQSVILASRYVGLPTDPDYFDLVAANAVIGGMFNSRINMNLREEKGYTYGARARLGYDLAGAQWTASAPVQADKTVPALKELLGEIAAVAEAEPITAAELDYARDAMVYGFPLRFENPGYLLGEQESVWRYGLPPDWIASYVAKLRAVTPEKAQAAWTGDVSGEQLAIVIVGDHARFRDELAATGLPVERRDVDGQPVSD